MSHLFSTDFGHHYSISILYFETLANIVANKCDFVKINELAHIMDSSNESIHAFRDQS